MPTGTRPTERGIRRLSDGQVEQVIGNLLRAGVLLAAVVVLIGAAIYLQRHGSERPPYWAFHEVPPALCHVPGVLRAALALQGRGMIQLGLLLLIATPIARVALSLLAFAIQRDRAYVIMTLIVLAILIYSLIGGGHL